MAKNRQLVQLDAQNDAASGGDGLPKVSEKEGGRAVTIAKVTAMQAVLVALFGVIGSGMTGYFGYLIAARNSPENKTVAVVPESTDVKTVPKISESGNEGIELLKDISIFDLRGWKQVPASEINNRFSPVNYINYVNQE